MNRIRILWLRWRAFWCRLACEIDETNMALHAESLERNAARLRRLEFELDRAYAPRSLILQALKRRGG